MVALLLVAAAFDNAALDKALTPPTGFESASPQQQQQELDAALNGFLAAQPDLQRQQASLLQTGSAGKKGKWSEQDTQETTEQLKKSYQDIDQVQNSLINAANKELAEVQKLPTLQQAETSWDTFNNWKPSSLLETKGKEAPDVIGGIDFSKVDQYSAQLKAENAKEQQEVGNLKKDEQKDEAFAQQAAAASSSATSQLQRLDRHEEQLAAAKSMLEKRQVQQELAHHDPLGHVMGRLERMENLMMDRAQKTGMKNPAAAFIFKKLAVLKALSTTARKLMVADHEDPPELRRLKLLKLMQILKTQSTGMKDHILAMKKRPMSLVENKKDVEEHKEPKDPIDSAFDMVKQRADMTTNRIQKNMAALQAKAGEAEEKELTALDRETAEGKMMPTLAWQTSAWEKEQMRHD